MIASRVAPESGTGYFVTGSLTYKTTPPTVTTPGNFQLQMWSFPVALVL